MSIVVVGLDHQHAPLDLLEAASLTADGLPKALAAISRRDNLSEVVLLSTCNRTEVYAVAERFHPGYEELWHFFTDFAAVEPARLGQHLRVANDDEAVAHLFRVAAGLESAVLGEVEILGQVRSAWDLARHEGAAGPVLNLAFRQAVEVGKRCRTQTSISRHITSVSQAAVVMAAERLDGLAGKRVLVLGAGTMAEGMVRNLASADAAEILIANRTAARARTVAEAVGGRAIELAEVLPTLPDVDLLLTSTGATSIILDHGDISSAIGDRSRPLVIVDVAVPRDIDPAVRDLPHVVLLDMDDLRRFADSGRERRAAEVSAVEQLLEEQMRRWVETRSAHQVAPLVGALHQEAERIRAAELERFRTTLDELTPEQRASVEHLTSAIVQKLLHPPSVALKRSAGTPKGDRLTTSVRDLFDL